MFFHFVKLLFRVPVILFLWMPLLLLQALSYSLRIPTRGIFLVYLSRISLWVAAIKVRVHGPRPERGTLLLSNHVSWLDTLLIGSVVPVSFVAKADVRHWPLLGIMSQIAGTIFINRDKRSETIKQKNAIQQRLAEGGRVVLFPEGSTGHNGTIVLPFKSALLASAATTEGEAPVKIQPMTLVFSELCGIPMGLRMRIEYAWVGRLNLMSRMLKVLFSDTITVDIIFYQPTDLQTMGGRKNLAKAAHRQVQDGLARFAVSHYTQI